MQPVQHDSPYTLPLAEDDGTELLAKGSNGLVHESIVNACVKVSAGGHSGSGTVVGVAEDSRRPGQYLALVVTCRHVCPRDSVYKVHFPGSDTREAIRISANDGADLACIVCPATKDTAYVYIADKPPAVGEDIWQVGYPGGRGPRDQWGRYHGQKLGRSVGASIRSIPGDSGSGVFNSKGELFAVLWGNGGGEPMLATGLEDVRGYLNDQRCYPWGKIISWLRRKPPGGGGGKPPGGGDKPMPVDPDKKPPDPVAPPSIDLTQLKQELIVIIKSEIAKIPAGPAGIKGDRGDRGFPGPRGEAGPAGRDADLSALLKRMDELEKKYADVEIEFRRRRP